MAVDWSYYEKFVGIMDKYLPDRGEGKTMATQICTAVNKLVYKWYNDGDVYDNTGAMSGWCNDLSDYANWLSRYAYAGAILNRIFNCYTGDEYEGILKSLADFLLDDYKLEKYSTLEKVGSIYNCEGAFVFEENWDDEEEDD